MCFKLDNGSELFSTHDMHRLRKAASGRMGSRSWVEPEAHKHDESCTDAVQQVQGREPEN